MGKETTDKQRKMTENNRKTTEKRLGKWGIPGTTIPEESFV